MSVPLGRRMQTWLCTMNWYPMRATVAMGTSILLPSVVQTLTIFVMNLLYMHA